MAPDIHRRAGELFDRLRDLPQDAAVKMLDADAGGDNELRGAVLRLLQADQEASGKGFLQNRALEDAATLLIEETEGFAATGTIVGNYRLERRIGAGGMGIVYQAEDLHLNRRVALKILHRGYAANDEEREQRFQQEVRAAALLNHPNVVALFDANRWNGHYYLAMEYVEGQTLREVIAANPRGAEVKAVLDSVAQVASALSAAHEAGIVHRDIKPENIMVRPDGFVKVLDFGLSKLRERSGDLSRSVSVFRSKAGSLAGTIHYLSPEQVAGRRVDGRSDLFSLGVVAYEFATGQRPFEGPTDGALFDAILNRVPAAPSAIRPEAGSELDSLIMQALEKDPELRFQTAADLRSCCRRLVRDPPAGQTARPHTERRIWQIAAVAAALALVGGGAAAAFWFRAAPSDPDSRQPYSFERLTNVPGEEIEPSISSDGKQFVYASATGNKWDIYLQRTGGSTAINLTQGVGDATQPALSPDGARIAFRAERDGGGLFVMEATGENPRRVTREGYFPAWAPDNRHLVYSEVNFSNPAARGAPVNLLHIVDITDGSQRSLATGDAVQPSWSPHGVRIAYWSLRAGGRRDIVTMAASGKESPVDVTNDPALDWNPVWSASGRYLYFLSDRGGSMNVWRVRIDEQSGRTLAPPEPVTVPANHVGGLSFGGKGNGFVYSSSLQEITLHRVDFDLRRQAVKGSPQAIAPGVHVISNFEFSPDGSKLVYDTIGDSLENLWIMNADGSGRRRLTSGSYNDRVPVWSPRGDEIVFFSDRGGSYDDWMIKPDGSGLRRLTALAKPDIQRSVWSPDGRQILSATNWGGPVFVDPRATSPLTNPPIAPGLEGIKSEGSLLFHDWYGRFATGDNNSEVLLYEPGHVIQTGVKGRFAMWPRDAANRDLRYFVFARGGDVILYDRTAQRETLLFSVAPNRIYYEASPPGGGSIYFTQMVRDGDLWFARFGADDSGQQ